MNRTEVVPIVPATCDIHIETEVIDLLKALRKKRSPRKERIFNDYLMVKGYFGRRPTYREVHLHGNENSREYRQAFGGYFAFLKEYGELGEYEERVYEKHYEWFSKVEKEQMTKSYKMVVLEYLLAKGPGKWHESTTPQEAAPYFHEFYMSKEYRKRIDFSSGNTKRLWDYDEERLARLIATMPMSKWVGSDDFVSFDGEVFQFTLDVEKEDEVILHSMTKQICEYKMHVFFERKGYNSLK